MIISKFRLDDLGCFLPNAYSEPDAVLPQLAGNSNWEVFSGWGNEFTVLCIAALREYWNGCYSGFFLVSKDFKPEEGHAIQLRQHIENFMVARNVMRLQTESVSCTGLRDWHRYLGFNLEGVKEKMMFNRDYDMWAIVRAPTKGG